MQKKQFLHLYRGELLLRHLPEALGTYLAREAGIVVQRFNPLQYLRDNFALRVSSGSTSLLIVCGLQRATCTLTINVFWPHTHA
jgi:hypothetical protein